MRTLAAPTLALAAAVLAAAPALAQKRGGAMEEFEEVDPYTGGEREKMRLLGYAAWGSIPWHASERTPDVQQTMGGIPMIWVETDHFRIGSSLGTYEIPNDRDERKRLAGEIARLKEKLGKLRAPRKELDPWLRVHLYAQRAEDLYAAFVEDFGLEPEDYTERGPHLGNPNKFLLLLCERRSEFSRYVRAYMQLENDHSFRWGWPRDCMFFGAAIEAFRDGWQEVQDLPWDTMLHCAVASGLAQSFAGGYSGKLSPPQWFGAAIGHVYARRVDPRWLYSAGRRAGQRPDEDYEWEPRVRNLVANRFYAKTDEMFGWLAYEELDVRDHMVVWSKLDFVLRGAKGDLPAFLAGICATTAPAEPQATAEKIRAEQVEALEASLGMTPAELDEAWADWVSKTYAKD